MSCPIRRTHSLAHSPTHSPTHSLTHFRYWTYSAEKQLVSQFEPSKCLTVHGGGGNANALQVTLELCGAAQYQTWDFVPVW